MPWEVIDIYINAYPRVKYTTIYTATAPQVKACAYKKKINNNIQSQNIGQLSHDDARERVFADVHGTQHIFDLPVMTYDAAALLLSIYCIEVQKKNTSKLLKDMRKKKLARRKQRYMRMLNAQMWECARLFFHI